jgi:hypothetical protein
MFSDFDEYRGGTFIMPGSHALSDNPATGHLPGLGSDTYEQSLPGELQLVGKAGDVFISDSRLWHAIATNHAPEPRVGLLVRYAPWWLNLSPTIQGSAENERMVVEYGGKNYDAAPLTSALVGQLSEPVRQLVSWNVVQEEWRGWFLAKGCDASLCAEHKVGTAAAGNNEAD